MIMQLLAPCSTSRFHLAGIRTSKFFNPGVCRVLTMHAYVLSQCAYLVHIRPHKVVQFVEDAIDDFHQKVPYRLSMQVHEGSSMYCVSSKQWLSIGG